MKKQFVLSALVPVIALVFTATAFAGTPLDKADATSINTDCANDAKTANCGTEVVGHGLRKCLHAYRHAQRRTNKSFTFSPTCEAALQKMKADKKAGL